MFAARNLDSRHGRFLLVEKSKKSLLGGRSRSIVGSFQAARGERQTATDRNCFSASPLRTTQPAL
jgi:hypothetical protein